MLELLSLRKGTTPTKEMFFNHLLCPPRKLTKGRDMGLRLTVLAMHARRDPLGHALSARR